MKQTEIIMGMPITVEVVGSTKKIAADTEAVFSYFRMIDNRFSTYKETSEITKVNNGLSRTKWSKQMVEIIDLAEETKKLTDGYFDINFNQVIDPSGLVKGWAIHQASLMLKDNYDNYYIEAGGDIEVSGLNTDQQPWRIGIRNPFKINEVVKVVQINNQGMATSGNYIRGGHVYNPLTKKTIDNPVSLTVIAIDVFEADRYATAAYAMGLQGINFIENNDHLSGYMIDKNGVATMTTNFRRYEI